MDQHWLSRAAAERLIGAPVGFLRRAAERGEGPAFVKLSKRVVRIDCADLLRWRDARIKPCGVPER